MPKTPNQINDQKYFDSFYQAIGKELETKYPAIKLKTARLDLVYQNKASAIFSSNIEGNSMDLNSFMNMEKNKNKFKPTKEYKEIQDLIKTYEAVKNRPLTETHFLKSHGTLSKKLLPANQCGKYRKEKVGVFSSSGLVYLAVEPELVKKEMKLFFSNLGQLLKQKLTIAESFYYASLYHLKFAHIHPFADGNGRAARLLEKWFLTKFLGDNAWKISSEQYYKEHQRVYYQNINLGVNYYQLDYNRCLPFLKMLAEAVLINQ